MVSTQAFLFLSDFCNLRPVLELSWEHSDSEHLQAFELHWEMQPATVI